MKIYAISGLGADKRVFQYLTLDYTIITIDWIEPLKNEPIHEYAKRLSAIINTNEPYILMGVSFGELIAVELSKILNPKLTILISSAETKDELKTSYRLFGKTKIGNILPKGLFNPPKRLAKYVFGAKNHTLLNQILDDTDLYFAKWATNQLTKWNNTTRVKNCFKISGENDKLIRPSKTTNTTIVKDGEHFMLVDKANEVSETINKLVLHTI